MDISLSSWLLTAVVAVVVLYVTSILPTFWAKRTLFGETAIALLLVGLPFLVVASLSVVSKTLLVMVQLWLLIVAARLVFGRLTDKFLQTSTKLNTLLALAMLLLVMIGVMVAAPIVADQAIHWLAFVVISLGFLAALVFIVQVVWALRHFRLPPTSHQFTARELPTVTLAIPARNETHALTECLAAAVASDYPKLEILVVDDCSQDKTSEQIRAFAHAGVRFIQGQQPATGWLGKNQAMMMLAEQATGEYILFADVDTHLSPGTITNLVSYAVGHDISMVSVLPQRRDGLRFATLLWQLRYYWQVVMPLTKHRVPVASQCWLIRHDALHHLGGFEALRHKIAPEGSLARRLFAVDMYRFLMSNAVLGVTTAKRWTSQNETALRFLYPTFKRQPLYVLIGVMLLAGLLLPFALSIGLAILQLWGALWWFSAATSVLLLISYFMVLVRAMPSTAWATVWMLPLSLAQELILLVMSMLLYEFGEVNWKGRNVCYPVISYQPRQILK